MNFVSIKITQIDLFLGWSLRACYRLCDHIAFRKRLQRSLKHGGVINSTLRSWHLGLLVRSVCCGAAPRLIVGERVQGRTCCAPWDGRDSSARLSGNLAGTELALLL